jgi:hypothetical protein
MPNLEPTSGDVPVARSGTDGAAPVAVAATVRVAKATDRLGVVMPCSGRSEYLRSQARELLHVRRRQAFERSFEDGVASSLNARRGRPALARQLQANDTAILGQRDSTSQAGSFQLVSDTHGARLADAKRAGNRIDRSTSLGLPEHDQTRHARCGTDGEHLIGYRERERADHVDVVRGIRVRHIARSEIC